VTMVVAKKKRPAMGQSRSANIAVPILTRGELARIVQRIRKIYKVRYHETKV
jgi:hypothetical protein